MLWLSSLLTLPAHQRCLSLQVFARSFKRDGERLKDKVLPLEIYKYGGWEGWRWIGFWGKYTSKTNYPIKKAGSTPSADNTAGIFLQPRKWFCRHFIWEAHVNKNHLKRTQCLRLQAIWERGIVTLTTGICFVNKSENLQKSLAIKVFLQKGFTCFSHKFCFFCITNIR